MSSSVNPMKPVAVAVATITLDRKNHGGGTIRLEKADGVTVTLPAATGSGDEYDIVVGTTLTSNGVIKVGNTTDTMFGVVQIVTDIAGVNMLATGTDDTITMNGSTTGGLAGSRVTVKDVKSGKWLVSGALLSTGAEASPFSATV